MIWKGTRHFLGLFSYSMLLLTCLFSTGGDHPPTDEKPTSNNSVEHAARWGSPVEDVVCRAHLKGGEMSLPAPCPVILYCDTKSLSPQAGEVFFTNPYGVYTLTVIGPDDESCPMTRYGEQKTRRLSSIHAYWYRLKLGNIRRCAFRLDYLYDMTIPGKYQIRFSREVRIGRQKQVVTSNTLTIELGNPDPRAARYIKVTEPEK